MKTISAKILKTSMLLSLFACSKQESPVAEIDFAYFKGQLGQISLNTSNSGTETFIQTTGLRMAAIRLSLK